MEWVTCVWPWVGGEEMRGLGLSFTNPLGTEGMWVVCLCLGCGSVGVSGGVCR